MNAPPTEEPPPPERERETRADEHEREIEQHEAYEYWGYLFKPDKTGTDKLKSLLRGLKDVMNERYEPSDQPDLTPNQLAHFYRDLHGNYDQLFLGTPNESIAFIYKSLGCLHSLQPPAYTHATAFTDPTVPALKTEGWIMWQTIQVLLGPEEHSSFLREAVQMYDVRDHDTGEIFPKILPRECFPREPDKHMVAWYEGVSERLRKEADEEERHRQVEVEHAPEVRRIHAREHGPRREEGVMSDEEGSVDSRGPALAYFRNPLYRHVDGRPSIVRRNSKRPALSPRQTMMDKGKEAANAFGRIAKNVGSPHLWDGRGSSRSRDRDHRRKSHPDNHYQYPEDAPPPTSAGAYDGRREHSGHSGHRRRRSSQLERPERPVSAAMSADDEWDQSEASPVYSPPPHPTGSNSSRHRHHGSRPVSRDQPLRHSRSHEPTPSQELEDDYFAGYDDPAKRRNSAHDKPFTPPPAPAPNGVGMSFGPSGGPLFASHVARQPQPPPMQRLPPPGPGPDPYEGGPPIQHPSIRRAQGAGRYPSRSPEPGVDPRDPRDPRDMRDPRHSRYDSPGRDHRPRYEQSPAPYDDLPPPQGGPPPPPGGGSYPPPRGDPRDRRLGSGRMSGSDLDQYYSAGEDRRGGRPKQTRFAERPVSGGGGGPPETGVSGRRYPEGSPWRRGS
ncbi:hypothetical protein M409DRAFT_65495 [Zasmidium cellare ATCC 36951]|uniref:DUF7514 domain-containing protein n=1 Tax=Zasmidium cellare ATCC 36951 TaxID=1080233 RepID=A0A6A6CS38_ZASCE|nr:uncharacterized protein M409DRAFT_65495 [Zasmidium cellare ATCC 36951]KAF2168579.1 hypothetical protein M409DRAFT_65495 [Zasmidium cellare ATCC 36951]